jgi:hypothetical protein
VDNCHKGKTRAPPQIAGFRTMGTPTAVRDSWSER